MLSSSLPFTVPMGQGELIKLSSQPHLSRVSISLHLSFSPFQLKLDIIKPQVRAKTITRTYHFHRKIEPSWTVSTLEKGRVSTTQTSHLATTASSRFLQAPIPFAWSGWISYQFSHSPGSCLLWLPLYDHLPLNLSMSFPNMVEYY